MRRSWTATAVVCVLARAAVAQPPTQPPAPNSAAKQVIGEVLSLDSSAQRVVVKDDHGATVTVSLGDRSSILRVAPGETDLKKAVRISFGDISDGDRVLAAGATSADGAQLQARTLVVMTKSDLAKKQQNEQQDWLKRGVSGTVAMVSPENKTLTVKAGTRTITVQPDERTEYRRYAPDSVKYSDSNPSSLPEIKPGDQIRVLGNPSGDGLTMTAERVVSGAFRQIAGTISSVNPDSGEVRVTDLASKKPVTVRINAGSVMKKLPPAVATILSRRFNPGAATSAPPDGPRPGPPGARGGGNGDLGQILDRLPPLSLAELKTGDAIMVSGSAGSDSARLTAITLLAGVEPLLTASPNAARDIMAGWNFGGEGAPE